MFIIELLWVIIVDSHVSKNSVKWFVFNLLCLR